VLVLTDRVPTTVLLLLRLLRLLLLLLLLLLILLRLLRLSYSLSAPTPFSTHARDNFHDFLLYDG
jgi:hypothetical protein